MTARTFVQCQRQRHFRSTSRTHKMKLMCQKGTVTDNRSSDGRYAVGHRSSDTGTLLSNRQCSRSFAIALLSHFDAAEKFLPEQVWSQAVHVEVDLSGKVQRTANQFSSTVDLHLPRSSAMLKRWEHRCEWRDNRDWSFRKRRFRRRQKRVECQSVMWWRRKWKHWRWLKLTFAFVLAPAAVVSVH